MSDAIPPRQQAAIYALLGRVFIGELDQQCLAALHDPDVLAVLDKLHAGVRGYVESTPWDERHLEQLASDYCHLFILPRKTGLSLLASHWLSSEETGAIDRVAALIGSFDVDLAEVGAPAYHVPNDHLGILLYFISSVFASEDPEVREKGPQLARIALYPWVLRFADKLSSATTNPIYLACTALLVELMQCEES